MFRRLRYAAAAYVETVTSGQHHIDQLNLAQLFKHATRFMAQAGSLATLTQRFPKDVGQEADQDVGQDSLFFLMPDRTQPKIVFVDAERRLRLRQLDVLFPKLFVVPIRFDPTSRSSLQRPKQQRRTNSSSYGNDLQEKTPPSCGRQI